MRFELYRARRGLLRRTQWRWRLIASNGRIIATGGEGYNNRRDALAIRPADATADLRLMLDLIPGRGGKGVTDPYYGKDDGFASTWEDVDAVASALVAEFSPKG